MSDPTTTNQFASIVDKAIKAGLDAGKGSIEAMIIADQPWLGFPVIKQLLELALSFVEGYFYKGAAITLTKVIIDIQVAEETSAVNQAFQNVQKAVDSGDQTEIKKASDALDASFASLSHYDGSASP